VLIDDEQRLLDALETAFRFRWPEAEVLTARNAGSGLALIVEQRPDAVVLDVGLPDRSGLDLLADLRRISDVPVIMLTAARDEMDHVRGLDLGADDYLTKPFAFVELLARVRALLRRGQPTPERLSVGDLTLDCIRRKVTRAAESIELAPKEFGILEYMMRNKGRPLSRTMIVEHVWDMDYDGLTNIVDVYIRHLRSKIDDRFPRKLIQTVRGIGYMIEAPDKAPEKPEEQPEERQV
jgi:two-component system copper resistance phosphate regulon response regulator CusR